MPNLHTMKALVSNRSIVTRLFNAATNKSIAGTGGRVQDDIPIPAITSNEILVKVKAVALNPTDFKHLDIISPPHSIIGCDFAGVVHRVGDAAKTRWKVGDRVAGAVHGGLFPDKGAFAEYLKVDHELAWKVPDHITDTDATTYGVSAVTAMLSLNVRHGLPFVDGSTPIQRDEAIFIYAGSTSAGLSNIQLAKAAGYSVVTTASPHSFDLVKKYGADAVYDYKSSTVVEEIIKDYPDISKAVDCFSEGKSTSVCAEVIKNKGGKVVILLPNGKSNFPNVTYDLVMAYTVFGHPFQWLPPIGPKFEARPADHDALIHYYEVLPRVTHVLKPIPTIELKAGFDGILEGLDQLRAGKVSGGKQVVRFGGE
ncbi:chaperonin 10-like protein [Dactylonectria estremocensis]|uniref:Chaperonin 10-like protein n=1 Tax=Dactylonectria estremocensis TaxID=1079267 RepID=A0A9P9J1J0_9HYPO|nr:chaperonin 10-like protein [Dactylonectria estremocensis]